jgi:hypothetical protein
MIESKQERVPRVMALEPRLSRHGVMNISQA